MKSIFLQGREFKPIPNCPGYYASADGLIGSMRARHCHQPRFHLQKLIADRDGYLRFAQTVFGNCCYMLVHHGVMAAWQGPRPKDCEARHLNGNKVDNHTENLRWGSHSENQADRRRHLSSAGERNHQARMTPEFVLRLRQQAQEVSLGKLCKMHPQYSKFALWAAASGYTWRHLPGAVVKNRKCFKR